MKELETYENKKILHLQKRILIALTVISLSIVETWIYFKKEMEFLLVLSGFATFIFSLMILFWIRDPYGRRNYSGTKLVIKKDRFVVYLKDGNRCYFPFEKMVHVRCGEKNAFVTIILEKSLLSIQIKNPKDEPVFIDNKTPKINEMIVKRLSAALERYKSDIDKKQH